MPNDKGIGSTSINFAASSPVVSAPSPCSFDGHMTSQGKCNVKDCKCPACNGVVSETGVQAGLVISGDAIKCGCGSLIKVGDDGHWHCTMENFPVKAASVLTEEQPFDIHVEAGRYIADEHLVGMVHSEQDLKVHLITFAEIVRQLSSRPEASHPQDERERFEEWANEKETFGSSWNGEFYDNNLHQAAWQGWQAALASRIRK